jgi:hypothetical protein
MSVTFTIATDSHNCENPFECSYCWSRMLNVHNANGAELIRALQIGSPEEPWGSIRGGELAAACRRVLADHNFDVEDRIPGGAIPPGVRGARVIQIPRPAGRLREHIQKLLHMAELAGDLGRVVWG